MTTYFITRHLGALAWAKQIQLHYDLHLEHLENIDDLKAGDIIIGTLPINMISILNDKGIRYIHLSLDIPAELRGVELDIEQLKVCNITLEEFHVKKI